MDDFVPMGESPVQTWLRLIREIERQIDEAILGPADSRAADELIRESGSTPPPPTEGDSR